MDKRVDTARTLAAQLTGVPAGQARRRALELLGELGIADRKNTYPAHLSGGERQRVAVARALMNRPALLLATWTRHAFSEITVHDLASGERRGAITVPGPDPAGADGAAERAPGDPRRCSIEQ